MVTPLIGITIAAAVRKPRHINVSTALCYKHPTQQPNKNPQIKSVACPPIFFAEIFKTVDAGCSPPAANFNVTALRTTFFMLAYRQR
jgi:hypothetical protein